MNYSQRHLVNGQLGDKEQGTGEAPGTLNENGLLYPPNDALMQFLQAMQLCVEANDSMSRRTKVEPLNSGTTSHSSTLHIGVGWRL